jgi:hypothetical protein
MNNRNIIIDNTQCPPYYEYIISVNKKLERARTILHPGYGVFKTELIDAELITNVFTI